MEQYISKSALVTEIERRISSFKKEKKTEKWSAGASQMNVVSLGARIAMLEEIKVLLDTIEVREVDLEKLGEIARHLIAVKEHIEDMRLDKEELFMLEKIGYPERFKAQKGK